MKDDAASLRAALVQFRIDQTKLATKVSVGVAVASMVGAAVVSYLFRAVGG